MPYHRRMRLSRMGINVVLLLSGSGCASAPVPPRADRIAPPSPAQRQVEASKVTIRVTLSPKLTLRGASGRLFVIMSGAKAPAEQLAFDILNPSAAWIAAREIPHLGAGETAVLDADELAFPHPFSKAKPGTYQLMAVLDVDHSFPYTSGPNPSDLWSSVVRAEVRAEGPSEIALTLDRRTEARATALSPSLRPVELRSSLLSAFWGRPIPIRAVVALPPGYDADPSRRYLGVYLVHGFGGSAQGNAETGAPAVLSAMAQGKQPKQILIFLEGSFATGHHVFADSVNNGPWGRALTEELIPLLEKTFRLIPEPRARFLTGHSSGGWSTLWLQVNYPDVFGGTWSTSPDPVDFRSFVGVNVTPGSSDNMYRTAAGSPRNVFRAEGKDVMSIEQLTQLEQVQGDYGGQLASFEWVFSPKGPSGAPARLFHRVTGELDPEVVSAWERYDIRRILEHRFPALAPKLRGKLHLIVGSKDSFHLEESMKLLCDFLQQKGSDAACEFVAERAHFDLYDKHPTYPNGLLARILEEMQKSFDASAKGR
jgi:hypothetical protein